MEAGDQVRSAHSKIDADRVAHVRPQRALANQGIGGAIEGDEFRSLVEQFLQVEATPPGGTTRAGRVELALDDVELFVDGGGRPSSGSTKIMPYIPLEMCAATGATAQ